MENIFDIGKVRYESAPPIKKKSFAERCRFYVEVIFDVIKVILFGIPMLLVSIKELIIPPPRKNIKGQLAVVTGGGNGIGRQIAINLAKEGCHVAIVDIDEEAAHSTAKDLLEYNIKAKAFKCDVADAKAVLEMKKAVERDMGNVDILINNAGLMPLLSLREGTVEEIEKIIQTNICSNIWTLRAFLSGMIERKNGHIMGISSMSAFHPMGGATIYSSTKFAVAGLMAALTEELRQENLGDYIQFTCVHPYFVSTRKDLMEAVNLRFPPITAEYTAEVAVDGLLKNLRVVAVPKYDQPLTSFVNLLPVEVKSLIRDYVLREKSSRVFGPYKASE